jgi:hypothetical protein
MGVLPPTRWAALQAQLEAAECDAQQAREQAIEAEGRAARAEKSARDAWQYVQILMRLDRRR